MDSLDLILISIFNDVLGPIMRGQSSSHTADSYYIGKLIRALIRKTPFEAIFTFDPDSSYVRVFKAHGADHALDVVSASSAFVCEDVVLGGYKNPISLDETVEAVFSLRKMLITELRCSSLGGLTVAPSALHLKKGEEHVDIE